MNFTAVEWIQILGFGALLGAAGQILRVVAGLKKLNDEANQKGVAVGDLFATSQLVVSILIGAVAGLLGAISLGVDPKAAIPAEKLSALLGIGYAGSDFIEAFMLRGARAASGTPGALLSPGEGTGTMPAGGAGTPHGEAVG
jgi:hypothetical protein